MRIIQASKTPACAGKEPITRALSTVSESWLQEVVETVAIPRHYWAEPVGNQWVGDWIADQLDSYGYRTLKQGPYRNIVALPHTMPQQPVILVGAHYDSVPGTPGADDNASAIAALLGCARTVACAEPDAPVCFTAFNREEEGFIGSSQFVRQYLPASGLRIAQAHILEMVGYCCHEPGSQRVPPALPIRLTDVGDFIGIIGNRDSNPLVDEVLQRARTYLPEFEVLGLKVFWRLEKFFLVLQRSDHASFWQARIPALMWTDTAEFRNPNYHRVSDTPDTLDFTFLRQVTQLLVAQVLGYAYKEPCGNS